tara:strand:+ start:285 stop:557 length:273 start_codon:yes stop_codon:yes gene_type:complete
MLDKMIRLDNRFVYKEKSKYYITDIVSVSEWRNMKMADKKKHKQEDITKKVKKLLRIYKPKSHINIKTKSSKKKIKTKKLKKKARVSEGG